MFYTERRGAPGTAWSSVQVHLELLITALHVYSVEAKELQKINLEERPQQARPCFRLGGHLSGGGAAFSMFACPGLSLDHSVASPRMRKSVLDLSSSPSRFLDMGLITLLFPTKLFQALMDSVPGAHPFFGNLRSLGRVRVGFV